MIRALFLDRDGVINEDYGYVYSIDKFVFRPGIFELAARARDREFVIIVITNQAGIGRGYYNEKDFDDLTKWMVNQFKLRGIDIVQTYWCPHHPTHGVGEYKKDCRFRKPNPGMILKAANDHGLDLAKSILIGNKLSDIEAGQQAGIKSLCFIGNDLVTEIPCEKITQLKEFKFY